MYQRISAAAEAAGAAEHRARMLAGLTGRVVEVGAGNGLNFAHYPDTVSEVIAVEPEPYLRTRATEAGVAARPPSPHPRRVRPDQRGGAQPGGRHDHRGRADRGPSRLLRGPGNRVRIATTGAAVWALFSAGTGLATSVTMLAIARVGAGAGKAVVTPTRSSLLADFYEPRARVKVFSAHRLASSVGQILGPVLAGVLEMLGRPT